MESDAPSSEIHIVPFECAKDRLGGESRVSTDQLNSSVASSSATPETPTVVVKFRRGGALSNSSNVAPAVRHERRRSNASELFSSVESMLMNLIKSAMFQ